MRTDSTTWGQKVIEKAVKNVASLHAKGYAIYRKK